MSNVDSAVASVDCFKRSRRQSLKKALNSCWLNNHRINYDIDEFEEPADDARIVGKVDYSWMDRIITCDAHNI